MPEPGVGHGDAAAVGAIPLGVGLADRERLLLLLPADLPARGGGAGALAALALRRRALASLALVGVGGRGTAVEAGLQVRQRLVDEDEVGGLELGSLHGLAVQGLGDRRHEVGVLHDLADLGEHGARLGGVLGDLRADLVELGHGLGAGLGVGALEAFDDARLDLERNARDHELLPDDLAEGVVARALELLEPLGDAFGPRAAEQTHGLLLDIGVHELDLARVDDGERLDGLGLELAAGVDGGGRGDSGIDAHCI